MLLARADSGKGNLECVPVDACAVVRGSAEQGEKLARTRGLKFNASVPDGPLSIQADADALRWALLILLDNAVKYTPQGGSVRIALETNGGFAVVSVSIRGSESRVRTSPTSSTDSGERIKPAPWEQGGAGLGLSIAKWIVDIHGGSIEVESESGKGSTFRLRVPLDEQGEGRIQ